MNAARSIQIFQILNQLGTILVGIVLAQYVVQDEIGSYELVVLISIFLGSFVFQGLIQSFLSQIGEGDLYRRKVLYNFFLITLGILWSVLIMIYLFKEPILRLISTQTDQIWLIPLLIYTGTVLPSYILAYWLMIQGKNRLIIYYGLFHFLAKLLVFYIPLSFGYGMDVAIWALMYSGILAFVILLVAIIPEMHYAIDQSLMQKLVWIGLGLIAYAIIGILPQYADAAIINFFYGDTDVYAVFRYGTKEIPFLGALTAGISSAALPLLALNQEQGKAFLREETTKLIRWLFPATVVAIVLAPWLFPLIYGDSFLFSGFLFSLLLISVIPRIVFVQTVWMHLGKTRILIFVSILELLLNVILSIVFVRYLGLMGILLGTIIAYFFEKTALSFLLSLRSIRLSELLPVRNITYYFTVSILAWILVFLVIKPDLI